MAYSPREMRECEERQIDSFSFVSSEDRIPAKPPIRPFKKMVNEILQDMDKNLEGELILRFIRFIETIAVTACQECFPSSIRREFK
jgi:hypothetical protein